MIEHNLYFTGFQKFRRCEIISIIIKCLINSENCVYPSIYQYHISVFLHVYILITFEKVTNPASFKYKEYRASDAKHFGVRVYIKKFLSDICQCHFFCKLRINYKIICYYGKKQTNDFYRFALSGCDFP